MPAAQRTHSRRHHPGLPEAPETEADAAVHEALQVPGWLVVVTEAALAVFFGRWDEAPGRDMDFTNSNVNSKSNNT